MKENIVDVTMLAFLVNAFTSFPWAVCAGFLATVLATVRIIHEIFKIRADYIKNKSGIKAINKKLK